jgi:hypothetical protein
MICVNFYSSPVSLSSLCLHQAKVKPEIVPAQVIKAVCHTAAAVCLSVKMAQSRPHIALAAGVAIRFQAGALNILKARANVGVTADNKDFNPIVNSNKAAYFLR